MLLLVDALRTISSMTSTVSSCRFGGPTSTPQSHGYGTNPSWLEWTVSGDDCRGMALHPSNQDRMQPHAAMAAKPHLTAICAHLGTNCSFSLRCSARFLLTLVDQARLQAHSQLQSAGTQQSMSSRTGWPRRSASHHARSSHTSSSTSTSRGRPLQHICSCALGLATHQAARALLLADVSHEDRVQNNGHPSSL